MNRWLRAPTGSLANLLSNYSNGIHSLCIFFINPLLARAGDNGFARLASFVDQ
jgi:hypothetical protein